MIALDLPGVSKDAIDIDVERNMLTVKAERRPVTKTEDVQMELSERPLGVFSRQVVLADTLDTEHIKADYGVSSRTWRPAPAARRPPPAGTPEPSFASWPSSPVRSSSVVSSPNSPPATPCCSRAELIQAD